MGTGMDAARAAGYRQDLRAVRDPHDIHALHSGSPAVPKVKGVGGAIIGDGHR